MANPYSPQELMLLQDARRAMQNKDGKQARAILQQITQQNPQNAEAWYLLGLIANPQQRLTFFQRALQHDPQHTKAQQMLEKLQAESSESAPVPAPAVPLSPPPKAPPAIRLDAPPAPIPLASPSKAQAPADDDDLSDLDFPMPKADDATPTPAPDDVHHTEVVHPIAQRLPVDAHPNSAPSPQPAQRWTLPPIDWQALGASLLDIAKVSAEEIGIFSMELIKSPYKIGLMVLYVGLLLIFRMNIVWITAVYLAYIRTPEQAYVLRTANQHLTRVADWLESLIKSHQS